MFGHFLLFVYHLVLEIVQTQLGLDLFGVQRVDFGFGEVDRAGDIEGSIVEFVDFRTHQRGP